MVEKTIPLTEAHQKLLEKRGITGEIAAQLGWQTCASRKGDWICIPFERAGKVVNRKYRRIVKIEGEGNFSQDTGGEQCFYNLAALEDIARLKPEEQAKVEIVITEGEMDTATALQCGYLAVSVPAGAPGKTIDNEDSVKYDFLADFPKFAIAVLAVDGDAAGTALRQDLALRLGWHRCKWVQYPKGQKDLNEVFVKYGRKGVDTVLRERARFLNEGGVFKMSELPDAPELPGMECGVANISTMIKPRRGGFGVFTGIPGHGKSLLVNVIACNMVRNHGWSPCIATFENNPRGEIQRELRTNYLGKPHMMGEYSNWTDAEISEADAWIDKNFTFIRPDDESDDLTTLKWLLTRIRAAITQNGANMIIIDPWNEIDHDRPQGMTLTEYTGYAIKELKRLARQYMVFVLVVAHPAKPEKNKNGGYNVPTLYDISDSAHWFNKCDIGVVVHRFDGEIEGTYGVLVRVAKIRIWGVLGRTGDRILEYLPERNQYIDAPEFRPKRPPTAAEKKPKAKAKKEDDEDSPRDLLGDKVA